MNGIELNASTATRSPGLGAELDEHGVEAFESLEELAVGEPGVAADQRLAIARDTYRSTQRDGRTCAWSEHRTRIRVAIAPGSRAAATVATRSP